MRFFTRAVFILLLFGFFCAPFATAQQNRRGAVEAVAVSHDGKIIAAGDGARVFLSDAPTGRVLRSLTSRDGGAISSLVTSPDGKTIAVVGSDVQVRDFATGALQFLFTKPNGVFHAAAFSPDGRILTVLGTSQESGEMMIEVHFWELRSGQLVRVLRDESGKNSLFDKVTHLNWAREGNALAIFGQRDAQTYAQLWDARNGATLRELSADEIAAQSTPEVEDAERALWSAGEMNGAVKTLAFSPDDRLLAAAGEGGIVRLWDTQTWKLSGSVELGAPVVDLAFGAFGEKLLLATATHEQKIVRVWDAHDGTLVAELPPLEEEVKSIAFSPTGSTLLVAGEGKTLGLWNGKTWRWQWKIEEPAAIGAAAFSPDGRFIATAQGNGIEWRDAQSGKVTRRFSPSTSRNSDAARRGEIGSLTISSDGALLAAFSNRFSEKTGEIRLWEISSGRLLSVSAVAHENGKIRFAPGEDELIIGFADGVLQRQQILGRTGTIVLLPLWRSGGTYRGLGRD